MQMVCPCAILFMYYTHHTTPLTIHTQQFVQFVKCVCIGMYVFSLFLFEQYGLLSLIRVGVKLPTVEVRYKNLCVEAECLVVAGKPLPTLWNTAKSIFSVSLLYLLFIHILGLSFDSNASMRTLLN